MDFRLDEIPVVEDYEWIGLMMNFQKEIQKDKPNWLPWATFACRYRGKIYTQIQIVISEMLIFKGINPMQILATVLPDDWIINPDVAKKETADKYCLQLLLIAKKLMENL
jgi:hypothetical protein